jgi:hypothetical protein
MTILYITTDRLWGAWQEWQKGLGLMIQAAMVKDGCILDMLRTLSLIVKIQMFIFIKNDLDR